jgi:hypothetical protein
VRKIYVSLALAASLILFNCGGGTTESEPEWPPEVKQVLSEMKTLEDLDESASEMLESLRAETLTKAGLERIESDSVVLFETFAPSNIKRYGSSIAQNGTIKNYSSQQKRSDVKINANQSLIDAYELIEADKPYGGLDTCIKYFNDNTLLQEMETKREIPKFSGSAVFVTIIKKDSDRFVVKSYKK